ncbi:MAG: SDR family NAD(P)-dependent oxidoreductase [Gaiellaceae bacterium]
MSAIAIVGMACRYADAASPDELWENVLAQRRAFRRLPDERLRVEDYFSADRAVPDRAYAVQAAVLDGWQFDRVRFRISGKSFRAADAAHWLALDVAADALADAGYAEGTGIDRERTLVVVGNTLTGEFSRARALRLRWPYVRRVVAARLAGTRMVESERGRFLDELEGDFKAPFGEVDDETLAGALSNTIAGRICNAFDLKGGGYTVDGACAASLLAVATAATALERGDADVALVGGVDLSLDPFELVGFAKAGALAADAMRVYDEKSEGFWPGEGCGFVVLRRLEDAIADGIEPAVAVRGWGVSSDGAGGITRPEIEGQVLALERAYARAGLDIGLVGLFEGHGTGTAIGDATELAALSQVRAVRGTTVRAPIGSVKANIGHTKAAAGIAGLIKAAIALREEVVPPTTACEEPRAELRREDATLRIVRQAESWPEGARLQAGVSAMGFGGVNTHVVLERVSAARGRRRLDADTRRLARSAQDAELFLFAGTRAAVASAVDQLRVAAHTLSFSELGDVAHDLFTRLESGDVRTAILASTPAELEQALERAATALGRDETLLVDEEAGVAVGSGPARIGFLFSGQAVTVGVDGGALARRFDSVRRAIEEAGLEAAADLVETSYAQPAIVASSLAGLALLRQLGVEANVAIGHSLGELSALHWAGAFDADALLQLARIRGRAMSALADRAGGMVGLAVDEPAAASFCSGTGAVVAGVNAPRQTVVAGDEPSLRVVRSRAEREGVAVTRLDVSHAFHSRLVAAAGPPLREELAAMSISPAHSGVVSTVTGAPLEPETDLRELLVRQVTSPVRFLPALRAAGDVDLFVEVGPGRILQRLAAQSVRVPAVALDVGGRSLRPALLAAGALFVTGAVSDVAPLYADRFVRPLRAHRFLANPCESAPADDVPVPSAPVARKEEDPEPAPGDSLATVRALVAQRAELPVDSVHPDARLLADLHLSSIVVAEVVASAARRLGVAPPAAPGELATATVAGIAEALDRCAATAPGAEPARVDGIASWVRAYERILVPREGDAAPRVPTTWTLVGDRADPFVAAAGEAFAGPGGEEGVVLVLSDRTDAVPARLVEAARAVVERRAARFALVQQANVAASFARTLQLETGIPCCVIGVEDVSSLPAAELEAESARGFAEVVLKGAERRVPILRPLEVADGDWPLRPNEVALVTGGGKGITAECALALSRKHGLTLSLVGRSDPDRDPALAANLRRFAAAGVRFLYTRCDVADADAVREAVRRTQRELGPVSAVLHGAGVNVPALVHDLDETAFRDALGPKVAGLQNVVAAIDEDELRLLVTFGSVIGAMGLAGEGHYALANEWLREAVEELAGRLQHCRCLDVAWSVWAGAGMGERLGTIDALARAGVEAVPLADGIALLERLIRAPGLPRSVLAVGRFGLPRTVELDCQPTQLRRFLERRLVDYPGIELVAEAELDLGTDPYLTDHRLDGVALLPAVLGIEAMAQAAETLLGVTPHTVVDLELERPITIPPDGKRTIRIAALRREDGTVEAAIRSDETAFQADHFRATLRSDAVEESEPVHGATPAHHVDIDPDTVYDTLLFHGPRFRRLRRYRTLHARSCSAEIDVRDSEWFRAYLPTPLVLGDPGARDAFIHILQACIPGTRVLPAGADRIAFVRRPASAVFVSACERSDDGTTLVWDMDVCDSQGELVERWQGLRLRRVGATPVPAPWPAPLLVPYLERRVAELSGYSVGLSVVADGDTDDAIASAAGRPLRIERAANGRPVADTGGVSAAHVQSLTLAVAGDAAVACDVEEARPRGEELWRDLLGNERLALARSLASELGEELDVSATRVWAAAECSRKTGRPQGEPFTFAGAPADGWALVRAGRAPVATFADRVIGFDTRLAFAFLVEDPE